MTCVDSRMLTRPNNTRKYSVTEAINKELMGQFIPSFITNTISFGQNCFAEGNTERDQKHISRNLSDLSDLKHMTLRKLAHAKERDFFFQKFLKQK